MYYTARPESSDGIVGNVVLCVVIVFIFIILFRGISAQRQCPGPAVVYTAGKAGGDDTAVLVPSVNYAEKNNKKETPTNSSDEPVVSYNANLNHVSPAAAGGAPPGSA